MKRKKHTERTFTVTLQNGYRGSAHADKDGWLTVSSPDGTRRAAIHSMPEEVLAQTLLGEIALAAGKH